MALRTSSKTLVHLDRGGLSPASQPRAICSKKKDVINNSSQRSLPMETDLETTRRRLREREDKITTLLKSMPRASKTMLHKLKENLEAERKELQARLEDFQRQLEDFGNAVEEREGPPALREADTDEAVLEDATLPNAKLEEGDAEGSIETVLEEADTEGSTQTVLEDTVESPVETALEGAALPDAKQKEANAEGTAETAEEDVAKPNAKLIEAVAKGALETPVVEDVTKPDATLSDAKPVLGEKIFCNNILPFVPTKKIPTITSEVPALGRSFDMPKHFCMVHGARLKASKFKSGLQSIVERSPDEQRRFEEWQAANPCPNPTSCGPCYLISTGRQVCHKCTEIRGWTQLFPCAKCNQPTCHRCYEVCSAYCGGIVCESCAQTCPGCEERFCGLQKVGFDCRVKKCKACQGDRGLCSSCRKSHRRYDCSESNCLVGKVVAIRTDYWDDEGLI